MQVVVNDLMTSYSRSGSGRVLLMLHGWGDTAQGLAGLATNLRSGYEVVSVDLPGFGGTQAPTEPWGLDNYATFVAAFCKKLGIEIYAVIGHSNGGAIAIRGIADGAFEVNKLVLLASAGVRGEYKGRVKALRYAVKAGKLMTAPLPTQYKKRLRGKVYKAVGSDMLVAEHMQETFKKVVTDDVRHDAAKIGAPTLLIYGDKDTATPAAWGRILQQKITGSNLVVVKGAAHFVHIDRPDEVAGLIKEFLDA